MGKSEVLPHALCGANAKRTGKSCRQPAMKNGRCRLHGGKSTGPKTKMGRDEIRKIHFKHGIYAKGSILERKFAHKQIRSLKDSLLEFSRKFIN